MSEAPLKYICRDLVIEVKELMGFSGVNKKSCGPIVEMKKETSLRYFSIFLSYKFLMSFFHGFSTL